MALRFTDASSSDCPPDRNTTPGIATGMVLWKAVTVAMAFCSGVFLGGQLWPKEERRSIFGLLC